MKRTGIEHNELRATGSGSLPTTSVTGLAVLALTAVLSLLPGRAAAETLTPVPDSFDQRAHIQAALDALPAERNHFATLRLEGRFVLGGPLLLDSYTRLDLSGARLELRTGSPVSVIANRNGLEGGEHHVEIIGGQISGNKRQLGGPGESCIAFYRTSRIKIQGTTVSDCALDGILISGRGQHTYFGVLRDILVERNLRHGIMVMWAMRNIRVESVVARANGNTGVVSDHSESDYNNIRAVRNGADGIFIRNVFHNNYNNLYAANNGRHGIRVLGLVESAGQSWHAFNNGGRSDFGPTADIFFTSEVLTYGITRATQIEGIQAGASFWTPSGATRHALLVEPVAEAEEDYSGLSFRGAILNGPRSLPPGGGIRLTSP